MSQSGDIVKDDSTEVSCGCTIKFASGDHGCSSFLPDTQAVGPFDVCLPPNLNLGQDAGAGGIPDDTWAMEVDDYCKTQVSTFVKDLQYMLSRALCLSNCITDVTCTHTMLNNLPHATGPNPACAKSCDVIECNYANCNPDQVEPDCGRNGFHIDACRCTQVDSNSVSWMPQCGVTAPSPAICIRSPGDQDPPTSAFSLTSWSSSLPNQITIDHAQSTADVKIHFDDGAGIGHNDEETFNVAGNVVLHGRCMPGQPCDVVLEMNLFPDDVTFHFSKVVCGTFCLQDIDATAASTAILGGTGSIPVHIDASGSGYIPMGVLSLHAETVLSGVPDQPTQVEIFNGESDRPIPFTADFANKTFSIPSAPFQLADGSGVLHLVGTIVNQPPMVEVAPPPTVECTSPTGGMATLSGTATDADNNVIDVEWWQGHVLGPGVGSAPSVTITAPFAPPRLTTPYSLSAEDGYLTLGIEQTSVTVQDTTPPVLQLSVGPSCLWPPNHRMVLYSLGDGVDAKATDVCDPSPKVFITSVTSNQPVTGGGSGNTSPDVVFGPSAFCVRSEREGTVPSGRQYTVTVKAVDASGNSTTKQVAINVRHDQGGVPCSMVDPTRVVDDGDPRCAQ